MIAPALHAAGALGAVDTSGLTRVFEHFLERLIELMPRLAAALVLLGVFYIAYRGAVRALREILKRTGADPALAGLGAQWLRYIILGLGVLVAANQVGVQVGSLLAGLGVAGLAVGLAAQETLANVIAGLVILWDRPFRIGDNVTIAGTYGEVREIGLRTTRIRTVEWLDAILPNKDVVAQEIVNHTLHPELRLPIRVSIAYKENTREARRALLEAVAGHPLILEDPSPAVVVTELADSGVNLELRVWLRNARTERDATWELLEISKEALDRAGIEIPFPQRTLHFADGGIRVETGEGSAGH